jgi:hypothetical protein
MNDAAAATLSVTGLILFSWSAMTWWKQRQKAKLENAPQAHLKWVTLMMFVGGGCLGAGIGTGSDFSSYKIGYFPVWLIVVAPCAFLFCLEMKGWLDHHVRTPVLGAIAAFGLCLAIGNGLVNYSLHAMHSVQTASKVQHQTGKKG